MSQESYVKQQLTTQESKQTIDTRVNEMIESIQEKYEDSKQLFDANTKDLQAKAQVVKSTIDQQLDNIDQFLSKAADRVQDASDRVFQTLHYGIDRIEGTTQSLENIRNNAGYRAMVALASITENVILHTSVINNASITLDQLAATKQQMIKALREESIKYQATTNEVINTAKKHYRIKFNEVKATYETGIKEAQERYTETLTNFKAAAENAVDGAASIATTEYESYKNQADKHLKDTMLTLANTYEKETDHLQQTIITKALDTHLKTFKETLVNVASPQIPRQDKAKFASIKPAIENIIRASMDKGIEVMVKQINAEAKLQAEHDSGKATLMTEATALKTKYADKPHEMTLRDLTILMLATKECTHEESQVAEYNKAHSTWSNNKSEWEQDHPTIDSVTPKYPYIEPTQPQEKFKNFNQDINLEQLKSDFSKQQQKTQTLIKADGAFAKLMKNSNDKTVARLLAECLKKQQGKSKKKTTDKQSESSIEEQENKAAPDFALKLLENTPPDLWEHIQRKGEALARHDGSTLSSFKSCIDKIGNAFKRLVGKGVSSQQVKMAAAELNEFMKQQDIGLDTTTRSTSQLVEVGKFTQKLAALKSNNQRTESGTGLP